MEAFEGGVWIGLLAASIVVLGDEARGQGSVESDREALEAFYHATDGPNWETSYGWLTDAPFREWYGVTEGNQGRAWGLDLFENRLSGQLPAELGQLTDMRVLTLDFNQLSGPIPPELGQLTDLGGLYLGYNQLSGPIPPELGRLNSRVLSLEGNQLSGPIPPELGQLTRTVELYLGVNQLSGPIPPELGQLTNLGALGLEENQLSGPIPVELGSLTSLQRLGIDNDTGLCLPSSIQETAFGQLAVQGGVPLCDEPSLTPKPPAVVQQAVNDAIATATNGEGLRTGGVTVTVPLDALFTFPSSDTAAASAVTFAGLTFSVSSTAPSVVSVSTTDAGGPGVVLTPGADAGMATITVDARPEGQPAATPVASVMFDVEVHTAVPALPAAASVLLMLLLTSAALGRYRVSGGRAYRAPSCAPCHSRRRL